MSVPDSTASNVTTGIPALVLMLRFYGIAIDARQLVHQYGGIIGETGILRCAKDLRLKARAVQSDWQRLQKTPLPAIAGRKDGTFFIISKAADTDLLILHEPAFAGKPEWLQTSPKP
jgi:subfamily B ATP-binding cassette protein HlyB/CyaB